MKAKFSSGKSCDSCQADMESNEYTLKCDEGCDYDVCVVCAAKGGVNIRPPPKAAAQHLKKQISSLGAAEHIKSEANPNHGVELYNEHTQILTEHGAVFENSVEGFKAGDVLLVVDMQNDFVPKNPETNPKGGLFGVAEGSQAAVEIVKLIKKATAAKAVIVATRDYHPKRHASFEANGGHFPVHCVQGTVGSHFYGPIHDALVEAKAAKADVRVVFKGFCPEVDSFGCFTYDKEYYTARTLGNDSTGAAAMIHSCCALDWTGSFCLECANIDDDINAPPDVMAVYERKTLIENLQTIDGGFKRMFAVGLAMDFCVADSAINCGKMKIATDGVFIITDAARAAHLPGIGQIGSGFLSEPEDLVHKFSDAGVRLMTSTAFK